MKTKIAILIGVLLSVAVSCSTNKNNKAQQKAPIADSTLFVTKNVALYDNIDSLLDKGVLCYNTQCEGKSLVDTNYNNISFQEASINCFCENNKKVRNVCFGNFYSAQQVQKDFNQLAIALNKKYGKPQRIKQGKIHNDEAFSTCFIYKTKNIMVLLNSTILKYPDNRGTAILIFTVPQDSLLFKAYLYPPF